MDKAEKGKIYKENKALGTQFEFRVLRRVKSRKRIAIRSAGSHSLIDIVVLQQGKQFNKLRLISCKRSGYIDKKEREEMVEVFNRFCEKPCKVQMEVYSFTSARKWKKRIITNVDKIGKFSGKYRTKI